MKTKLDSLIKVAITPNIVIKALESRMKILNNHLKNYKTDPKQYNNLYKKTKNQIFNIKGKFQDEWANSNVKPGTKFNEAIESDRILGDSIRNIEDKNRIYFG